jgi:outer membrane protein OmpA-like peptidoglycan-associated protein
MDGMMLNRLWMSRRAGALGALITLCAAAPAAAQQNPVIDAQGMRPSPSPYAVFGVDTADTSEALDFALGAWLNYASAPIVEQRPGSDKVVPVVDQQLALHLTGALGVARRVELGFDMPLLMINNGVSNGASFGGVVLGDLAVRAKGTAFSSRDHAVGLAGIVELRAPTGDDTVFASDGGFVGSPRLVLDTRLGPATLAANLGLALRSARAVRDLTYSSEITYGLAARVNILRGDLLAIDASVHGRTQLRSPLSDESTSPLEALLGVRLRTPAGVIVGMGAGGGLAEGLTAPDFRAVVSVGWAATLKRDEGVVAMSADADAPMDVATKTTDASADAADAPPTDAPPVDAPPVDAPPVEPPKRTNIARVEGDLIVFEKGELDFKFGSSKLRDTSLPLLDDVAALLAAQPALRVEIGAHTDTLGDPDENITLSAKQAAVVRDYLVAKGVAADRLEVKGYGGEQPIIAEEQSAEDEETNRRVVLTILR